MTYRNRRLLNLAHDCPCMAQFQHACTEYQGAVIAIPCATGDCWVIDSQDSVHYVQTFAQIVKRKQS